MARDGERQRRHLLDVRHQQRQECEAGGFDRRSKKGAAGRSQPSEVSIATSQALAGLT
jgi:hypothetical protein